MATVVDRDAAAVTTARLLIVDDQAEVLRMIDRILGKEYDCQCVETGEEARVVLSREEVDLVVCDVELAGESGLALGAEIIADHPNMALMFVTGIDDPSVAETASELGAHGYLVKPFGRGQLVIATQLALRRRELEVAHRSHERNLELRLQAIIDRAPMPIYAKDRDGRYVIANRRACELAGVKPEELLGLTDDAIMAPESASGARETDNWVLETGQVLEREESRMVGREERIFMTLKFPLAEEDGSLAAVCGISPDITAQRHAVKLQEDLAAAQKLAIEELRASRLETVERLARAIELYDPGTGEHVNRMAAVAALLADKLSLESARVALLRAAAPMHDVGKIGIPAAIISKPGALTPEERKEMERHTEIGNELLGGSKNALLRMAAMIALTHHEHFDGTGYPRGLAGPDIPIEGRLVAVADVFDALLSDRSYRPAMSLDEAVKIIEEGKGSHFDPEPADLLLTNLDEALAIRG